MSRGLSQEVTQRKRSLNRTCRRQERPLGVLSRLPRDTLKRQQRQLEDTLKLPLRQLEVIFLQASPRTCLDLPPPTRARVFLPKKPLRTNTHLPQGVLGPFLVHQERSESPYSPMNEQAANPSIKPSQTPRRVPTSIHPQLDLLPQTPARVFLPKRPPRTNTHPPPRVLAPFPVHQENSESLYYPTNEPVANPSTKPSQTPKRILTSLNLLL